MKKKLLMAPLLVGAMFFATAQDTTNRNNKTTGNKNQSTKSTNSTNKNKNTITTTTTTTGTGNTSGNTGTNQTGSGTNQATTNTSTGTSGSTGSGTNRTGTTGTTGTTSNTTTTGTTGSGNNNTTSGNTTGTNQGNTGTDHAGMNHGTDAGGQLTSAGRYAAMGVQPGSLHRKDLKFIMLANSSNKLEIEASRLALQNASNTAVKDFARMMVDHHTMAASEMKTMLSSKGAMIPDTVLLPRHRMQMEMLSNLQGAEFDKMYTRIMVDAHEEDVDEFEDEVTDARDADIRAFTAKMLPTLQMHYTRSKELRKQLR